jgi:multidrug efflux pump subunit AcrA (membrane-fusion protein)
VARRRRLRTGVVVGGVVLVAAMVGGGVAYAQAGSTAGYRTAGVTRGSITAGLDLVGTIVPTHSATVGFAQPGTVAAVDVSIGSPVTAGQTLAQLDLTPLQARLAQAKAVEAAARQTLAAAESGQLSTPSGDSGGSSSGSSGTSASSSSTTSGSDTSSSAGTAAITSAQRAVVSAQKDVDSARTIAQGDLRAATAGCSPSGSTPPDTQACLAAETTLLTAQQDLASKESALSAAQTTLSKALTTSAAAAAAQTTTKAAVTTPTVVPVSATQLAAYQAAVDADAAAVDVAQQNLDQGTAVSPISGTVVAVGLTRGQSVSAASSAAVFTVSASDGYQATTVVPVASIGQVMMGQQATIVQDGDPATLAGTVVGIGATPTASGYPVTLGLPAGASGLRQGVSASVRLTTGKIASAVVVPTSAVHTFGTRHVVEVLSGGTLTPAVVTLGIVDPLHTQVVTGVKVGQQVVLADLSSTVTSDSSTSGSSGGLGGLTTGRGLGGGGFGGGRTARAGG